MLALLLLVCAATALKAPSSLPRQYGNFTLNRLQRTRTKLAEPSELKVTQNVVNLTRADTAVSVSSTYTQNGTTPLISLEGGQVFLANVLVGGQEYSLVIDTGSSDPWLAVTDFSCYDPIDDAPLDQYLCEFGPLYHSTQSSTFVPIADQNFNISYADGEYLTGSLAYESFRMAGIDVPNQQFGVVDQAAWYGDGISSGLVGFAYRTLTSAYAGSDPTSDRKGRTMLYNPLFVNMYENEGVPTVFSMAIDRIQSNGGVLAIGGIPDIPHAPYWANTEIHPVSVNTTSGEPVYEFYTIDVDGFAISTSTSTQFNPYDNDNPYKTPLVGNDTDVIVDSGTSLCYVPDDVAAELADAFDPPATWDASTYAYFVDCDATAPVFGVSIEEKIFFVNAEDIIIQINDNLCVTGIQPNLGGLNILGGTFMKNVLTVFDIGAEQLRFAARQFYPTS
ncbi:hypothetical protein M409DRAFT_71135 [Zasmidium cellare ATCC 36951]|uniref:Peptidase A1 domain-containing protein n=1 Tax=Zasmidium cellare ATCC 36951 TaxID=1080233 RepID=A0A6A6C0K7_ZASCE|nr:uncharacterized protein M409DRAFT_71135 [Zasmidium cellare ATCC 36951]KAF2159236.1 hypothetical protein M409DRAFT_71135 [Zasmidium cellare ATCC 36951]